MPDRRPETSRPQTPPPATSMGPGPDKAGPDKPGPGYSGRDARQGEIILRTRARRIVFIAGLVALVGLALIARCAGYV